MNSVANRKMTDFAISVDKKTPKIVSSTIFPDGMYSAVRSRQELYRKYNSRLLPKAKRGKWGTYFERMTAYNQNGVFVNQLENIISAINQRDRELHAAYTMLIQYPGNETLRTMGGPCLNYLAVQIEDGKVGLLAVYRNHEFLERAYGNYLGLCTLIKFIAKETGQRPGMLTCISSHAFASGSKRELKQIATSIKNEFVS